MGDYSPIWLDHYRSLLDKLRPLSSWTEIAATCFADFEASQPATPAELRRAEAALGMALPQELAQLQLECGGVLAHYRTRLVLPLDELVELNRRFRCDESFAELYMPFDNLLLFGEEGNGDLYAWPVSASGTVSWRIFEWDHENDSRTSRATSIRDLFARLASDRFDSAIR
jgi:hypothetical protein